MVVFIENLVSLVALLLQLNAMTQTLLFLQEIIELVGIF